MLGAQENNEVKIFIWQTKMADRCQLLYLLRATAFKSILDVAILASRTVTYTCSGRVAFSWLERQKLGNWFLRESEKRGCGYFLSIMKKCLDNLPSSYVHTDTHMQKYSSGNHGIFETTCWRDGSVVRSTCHSCRGLGLPLITHMAPYNHL